MKSQKNFSRVKNLHAAADHLNLAAMTLRIIGDYPDCINDIQAQADYLRSEAIVEAEKNKLNVWIKDEKSQKD